MAVWSGLPQSAERYATKITVPMPLVKFSAVMAKVSHATSRPTTACHAKAKMATACKTPPIQRLVAIGKRARDETTSKATGNCRSKSDALDDGGELYTREAGFEHERRRQGAREGVGEFENHHEGQRRDGHIA